MAEKITIDSPPSENLFANAPKDIELSINRLERMLDWLLIVRGKIIFTYNISAQVADFISPFVKCLENVANMNLDLYSTFKPLEALQESNQTIQNDAKIVCPLHPDCERVTNLVASNLNKILDQ